MLFVTAKIIVVITEIKKHEVEATPAKALEFSHCRLRSFTVVCAVATVCSSTVNGSIKKITI